jgi:hypothetical protein
VTLPLFVAADAPRRDRDGDRDLAKENADLRAYVDRLEDKVRALQEEVRELKRLRSAQPAPRIIPTPPRPPEYRDAPNPPLMPRIEPKGDRQHWQERRFNGGTYYIIPLAPEDLTPPRRP